MNHQLSKEELRERKHNRKEFPNIKRNNVYIILDDLKSAHNTGTILRLADALLVKKVYICGERAILPPNKKIRTSSRGAERWAPWEYIPKSTDIAKELKNDGIPLVAVEISNESIDLRDFQAMESVCFIFGNEYVGVSKELLDLADVTVHLPILGMTNSINVSTAASVVLYDNYYKMEKFKDLNNNFNI